MKKETKGKFYRTLALSLTTFAVLLVSLVIAVAMIYIFVYFGVIYVEIGSIGDYTKLLLIMAAISVGVGSALSILAGKFPLRPVNKLVNAMDRLAQGDYKTRLPVKEQSGMHLAFGAATDSFNKLAEELENTEMLRSDFINNFAHEFKTPIVSIAGFAKLLKRGDLTEEEKMEYVDVIEEESLRLSALATGVLNLTKVENQNILTNTSKFNVSEQIRSAVLLLEDKWNKKNLELDLDFDEFYVEANEEMLKEVWINLIDNAIKFSPEYGPLKVDIHENEGILTVDVINSGSIDQEKLPKLFNKFYQVDESHYSLGYGVGLAIVKGVVELHKGSVEAHSQDETVRLTVKMPIHQQ